MWAGGVDIDGNFPELLKAVDWNWSLRNFSSFGMFASIAGNGTQAGRSGIDVLLGMWSFFSCWWLVLGAIEVSADAVSLTIGYGNVAGRMLTSVQPRRLK